jgi:hypothetical protein
MRIRASLVALAALLVAVQTAQALTQPEIDKGTKRAQAG